MTEILKSAVERGASDIFVVAGLPLTYKVRGEQQRETADGAFTPEKTEAFAAEIYRLAAREPHCLNGSATDDDFSFSLSGTGRFRVNLFRQRGSIAAVVRVIRFGADVAAMTPEAFVERFLVPLHPALIVVGENFRFGARAAGDGDVIDRLVCVDERVEALENNNTPHRYTIEELEAIRKHYSALRRQLVKAREAA